jgi:Mlc titration factor MtfA (ptsG expression regulator)
MQKYSDITLTKANLSGFYGEYFSYYRTLDNKYQELFISRCLRFISEKIIIGAEGFEPDNKVRAIIAASAVQLTLGLEHWTLDYFDTIIIHPSDFEHKSSGNKHRGETNLGGFVKLSWESFISGYRIADDNINLGLHEFTHALRFNAFRGNEQDYFVEHYFNRWLGAATEAYNDIREKRDTIFRKYGGANINEFMSVCIEHFFESPEQIKAKYPFLYFSTAILLNQETTDSFTRLNVREQLFAEQNAASKPVNGYSASSCFRRSASCVVMGITSIPFILTAIMAGIFNPGSLVLLAVIILVYLRFDFFATSFQANGVHAKITKGFFLFRKRSVKNFLLSQLVSLRVEEEPGGSDWEIVFYNPANQAFYNEVISSCKHADRGFLENMWTNKVAIFIKQGFLKS